MALSKLHSASAHGITAVPVVVEADVADGLPNFTVVGLVDKAVDESRERVRSALKHSGYQFPLSRITINLTPSDSKKTGIHFDLPIAVAILIADGQLNPTIDLSEVLMIGGLSLDGSIQSVPGVLIFVDWAKSAGLKTVIVPEANYREALLIKGIEIIPVKIFSEVVDLLLGREMPPRPKAEPLLDNSESFAESWLQIQGQAQAKRAALIAVSGGHNLLLEGPPGSGKTLLSKGMRALLPKPSHAELVEIIKLHSLAGQLNERSVDTIGRPFRSPHHTASNVAIVGGGSLAHPGEISLAHNGILFLDELPEFQRAVIEALRQPLEDGEVFITRVERTTRYPASFMLVATMNPCPCGWSGSNLKPCRCSPFEIAQYRKKISGPILDRIDLRLTMPFVEVASLKNTQADTSELKLFQDLVVKARKIQQLRNHGKLNAQLSGRQVGLICLMSSDAEHLATRAANQFILTGRGYHKLLKVSRTIADLTDHKIIESSDVAEALRYRLTEEN